MKWHRTTSLGFLIEVRLSTPKIRFGSNQVLFLRLDKKRLRIPYLDDKDVASNNVTDRIALTYWTRSAAQDNVDALLKTGDYYYAGLGATEERSLEKAASFYRSAANSHTSAMAMWNLGWLHETGRGVTQVSLHCHSEARVSTD